MQVSNTFCDFLGHRFDFNLFSKPALLEGLEIDQYIWSVIQSPQCVEAEEVSIDSGANMRPVFIKSENGECAGSDSKQMMPISPGSIKLPSLGPWDIPTSKSPGLYAPPDINSKLNVEKVILSNDCYFPGIVSGQYPLEEGPLSQMSEAVANIDKSEAPGGPCTPHTPGMPATPNTPGTGHKSPRSGNNRLVVLPGVRKMFYIFKT